MIYLTLPQVLKSVVIIITVYSLIIQLVHLTVNLIDYAYSLREDLLKKSSAIDQVKKYMYRIAFTSFIMLVILTLIIPLIELWIIKIN